MKGLYSAGYLLRPLYGTGTVPMYVSTHSTLQIRDLQVPTIQAQCPEHGARSYRSLRWCVFTVHKFLEIGMKIQQNCLQTQRHLLHFVRLAILFSLRDVLPSFPPILLLPLPVARSHPLRSLLVHYV